MEDLFDVMNSVCLSSPYPLSIQKFLEDYKNLTGSKLNVEKVGFGCLKDAILANKKLAATQHDNTVYVTNLRDDNSKAIEDLVSKQNNLKKKKSAPPVTKAFVRKNAMKGSVLGQPSPDMQLKTCNVCNISFASNDLQNHLRSAKHKELENKAKEKKITTSSSRSTSSRRRGRKSLPSHLDPYSGANYDNRNAYEIKQEKVDVRLSSRTGISGIDGAPYIPNSFNNNNNNNYKFDTNYQENNEKINNKTDTENGENNKLENEYNPTNTTTLTTAQTTPSPTSPFVATTTTIDGNVNKNDQSIKTTGQSARKTSSEGLWSSENYNRITFQDMINMDPKQLLEEATEVFEKRLKFAEMQDRNHDEEIERENLRGRRQSVDKSNFASPQSYTKSKKLEIAKSEEEWELFMSKHSKSSNRSTRTDFVEKQNEEDENDPVISTNFSFENISNNKLGKKITVNLATGANEMKIVFVFKDVKQLDIETVNLIKNKNVVVIPLSE
ncbi:hypothetical protein SNEBB_003301 [Seison nebaliae]|nr:hypothetical protein SNEBB_003301 [Seison nebaliae]